MPNFSSGTRRPFARETLTVSTTVKQLTPNTYNDAAGFGPTGKGSEGVGNLSRRASGAVISVETNAIRFTIDGTTPVAVTTGIKLNPGDIKVLESYQEIVNFKAVRDGAADGTIPVDVYR